VIPLCQCIPFVEERLIDLKQRRVVVCKNLLVDHPLQPPMIGPIQFVPADAERTDDHTRIDIANIDVSSSQLNSPIETVETSEPSIIHNLVDHYLGELPEYESNQEKASDIASDEVMTEIRQEHETNQEMISSTNLNSVLISEPVLELVVPELSVSKQVILNQQPTNTISTEPKTSINDQPSSSNLAIQPLAPAKTNVPSPPTLFLDSTILADVCENIFQELNNLVQARNNLIHEDNYEKTWIRLKDRVEYVLTELQRTCLDAQDIAQTKLQDWLKGVVSNLDEVKVLKTWVKTPLCLRARNATDFIPSSIHLRELDLNWLNKINLKEASTELALMQKNTLLEKENKQLKKELLKQKLLLLEYKTASEAKLEEARIREENLIRINDEFKKEMKEQAEETNRMMKQMVEMFQKQAQP